MKPQALNRGLQHMLESERDKAATTLLDAKEAAGSVAVHLASFLSQGSIESLQHAEYFLDLLQGNMRLIRTMMTRKEGYDAGTIDGHREGSQTGYADGYEAGVIESAQEMPNLQGILAQVVNQQHSTQFFVLQGGIRHDHRR